MEDSNIQRISLEEIQEFSHLDLYNLTWEQTNGRRVILAYDPRSHTFGYSYSQPGTDGGNQNMTLFYGYSDIIANFIDADDLSARPSINGFDDGDGIITTSTIGSVNKFDFFDVEINEALGIDRYVFKMSLISPNVDTPVKGIDYFDGVTPVKGVDYFDGYTPIKGIDYFDGKDGKDGVTPVKGVDYFDGEDGITPQKGVDYFDGKDADGNLQKVIKYPDNFISGNYTLKNDDNNYEIIVDNGANPVTITVPAGLSSSFGVGFTQKGVGNILFVAGSTVTINTPIGLYLLGRFFQTYLSQEKLTNVFYLGGNTKATSDAYSPGTGTGTGTLPGAPSNLNGSSAGPGEVRLTWSASSGNPSSYLIYRNSIYIATVPANGSLVYVDVTGDDISREYKLKAENSVGQSVFSSAINVAGGAAPTSSSNRVLLPNLYDDPCGVVIPVWRESVVNGLFYTSEFGSTLIDGYVYDYNGYSDQSETETTWSYDEIREGVVVSSNVTQSFCSPN